MGTCERNFRGREIPLRSDQDQNFLWPRAPVCLRKFGQNLLQVPRPWLQGADQTEIEIRRGRMGQKLVRCLRGMDLGEPVLTGLLGRFQGNSLPFRLFLGA